MTTIAISSKWDLLQCILLICLSAKGPKRVVPVSPLVNCRSNFISIGKSLFNTNNNRSGQRSRAVVVELDLNVFMNLSINTKAYLEPCQVSLMEFLGEIVNGFP